MGRGMAGLGDDPRPVSLGVRRIVLADCEADEQEDRDEPEYGQEQPPVGLHDLPGCWMFHGVSSVEARDPEVATVGVAGVESTW